MYLLCVAQNNLKFVDYLCCDLMYDLYEPQEAFEVLLSTSVFVWALLLDVFRVLCKVCVCCVPGTIRDFSF